MRKHTKRRHYALVNPLAHAIEGARITTQEDLNKLRLRELSALDSYRQGTATVYDWRALADMSNLCETMAKSGIGPEALNAVQAAESALLAAYERHNETGAIGCAPGEYEALRDLYEYHDIQRASVSRNVYEKSIQSTTNRIRSGDPRVKVLT